MERFGILQIVMRQAIKKEDTLKNLWVIRV
jgi:hypothetical protein